MAGPTSAGKPLTDALARAARLCNHSARRALTVRAVAELLGHSSPALVMARYGHAYAAEKARSAMALERFCSGGI